MKQIKIIAVIVLTVILSVSATRGYAQKNPNDDVYQEKLSAVMQECSDIHWDIAGLYATLRELADSDSVHAKMVEMDIHFCHDELRRVDAELAQLYTNIGESTLYCKNRYLNQIDEMRMGTIR